MSYETHFWGTLELNHPLDAAGRAAFESFVAQPVGAISSAASRPEAPCRWELTADGAGLQWNGIAKCYDYEPWLRHIITDFVKPRGLQLSGKVRFSGEADADEGEIRVIYNKVTVRNVAPAW
ncbi:MAG: hypothetical protein ACYC3L_12775 [Gemmatimonadaceae bacterium]